MSSLTPEQLARETIDGMLSASGWVVQTRDKINLMASRGVAVCELSFATGEPDYTLFVDGKALGTVEAKPVGHSLVGVEEQSAKYVAGVPAGLPAWHNPLPFCHESTGQETGFTNRLDPDPRSRTIFAFHRPETLITWAQAKKQLAQRLREMPVLSSAGLWPAQVIAITNLEESFAKGHRRALIQMATGSGKTFTADQIAWLNLIRDHIATSLSIEPDDFDYAPFSQRGGLGKADQLFGNDLNRILDELNLKLVA